MLRWGSWAVKFYFKLAAFRACKVEDNVNKSGGVMRLFCLRLGEIRGLL